MTHPTEPDLLADDAATPTSPPVPEEARFAPPVSSGAPDPYLEMIAQAAREKDVGVVERLIAAKERLEAHQASLAFADAFIALQADLPSIDRDGRVVIYSKKDRTEDGVKEGATPIQKTPYATINSILAALRAPLAKHGFSLRFEHDTTPDNRLITTAILRHRLGHSESASTPPLQHDATGSKNSAQAVGSALTYGRRYALMAVLPIVSHAPEDADDDGVAAGRVLIDADQLAYIEQLLRDTGIDIARFLEKVRAQSLPGLTVKQYQSGLDHIREYQRRKAQKAAQ
jgi:hypothetical protein